MSDKEKTYEELIQEMNDQYSQIFERLGLKEDFEKYEKANQFLHEALEATNPEDAKKLVNKALKADPDNFDAKIFKATITEADSAKQIVLFDKLLAEEEKALRDSGCFEYEGDFWLEVETRPYMRGLAHKMAILEDLDRCREAVAVGERMIQLNNNDNMGVRYQLMPLYGLLEETDKAVALNKKYKNEKSVGMLLPLAVCYYRAGLYSKCDKALKIMFEINPHAETIIDAKNTFESEGSDFYSPGEPSEVFQALENSRNLLAGTFSFFDYLEEFKLKNMKL